MFFFIVVVTPVLTQLGKKVFCFGFLHQRAPTYTWRRTRMQKRTAVSLTNELHRHLRSLHHHRHHHHQEIWQRSFQWQPGAEQGQSKETPTEYVPRSLTLLPPRASTNPFAMQRDTSTRPLRPGLRNQKSLFCVGAHIPCPLSFRRPAHQQALVGASRGVLIKKANVLHPGRKRMEEAGKGVIAR